MRQRPVTIRIPPLLGDTAIAKTLLFVYGTLKRGLHNHFRMADQEYLGDVVTEPRYRVFDLGPYPGLVVDTENGLAVQGELWAMNDRCLAEVDEFEEVPTWFKREPIAIAGRQDVVYAYYLSTPAPTERASGDRWPLTG